MRHRLDTVKPKFWRYIYSFWQNVQTWQTDRQTHGSASRALLTIREKFFYNSTFPLYCTVCTADKHEASRGYYATAELLVVSGQPAMQKNYLTEYTETRELDFSLPRLFAPGSEIPGVKFSLPETFASWNFRSHQWIQQGAYSFMEKTWHFATLL